jgi:uncharacterized alpha-E superfamily protein
MWSTFFASSPPLACTRAAAVRLSRNLFKTVSASFTASPEITVWPSSCCPKNPQSTMDTVQKHRVRALSVRTRVSTTVGE